MPRIPRPDSSVPPSSCAKWRSASRNGTGRRNGTRARQPRKAGPKTTGSVASRTNEAFSLLIVGTGVLPCQGRIRLGMTRVASKTTKKTAKHKPAAKKPAAKAAAAKKTAAKAKPAPQAARSTLRQSLPAKATASPRQPRSTPRPPPSRESQADRPKLAAAKKPGVIAGQGRREGSAAQDAASRARTRRPAMPTPAAGHVRCRRAQDDRARQSPRLCHL